MSTATAIDVLPFAALVGEEHALAARADDTVQGVSPSLVVEPADEAEVSAVMREASRQRLAVVVRGGGTTLAWGTPPRRCELLLSTCRLDRLVELQPGDLICVAGAGMTLAALQAHLGRAQGHRQRLMLDPPVPPEVATLGGIVATGCSGPLRTRYGTVRDLLIGVRFVLADGTRGHAGGKVVKNVAGYDIGKLLTGSLGTLAVITQVALRLHPVAPDSRVVLLDDSSPEALAARVQGLARLPVTPSCVDVVWPDRTCAVRVDSSAEGAERQVQIITARVGGRILGEGEAAALNTSLAERPWMRDGVVAGIAAPRSRLAELIRLGGRHADEVVVRGLIGVAEARLDADPAPITALRDGVEQLGGHLVLHRSPLPLRDLVWPAAAGAAVELMRSVKHALDPQGVLAPGRHLGGI